MSELFNETKWSLVDNSYSFVYSHSSSRSIYFYTRLICLFHIYITIILIMPASRDDDVYQAKLAEQAERYEGK
jgi:hypothetical protein